jgi:hypothetical protein
MTAIASALLLFALTPVPSPAKPGEGRTKGQPLHDFPNRCQFSLDIFDDQDDGRVHAEHRPGAVSLSPLSRLCGRGDGGEGKPAADLDKLREQIARDMESVEKRLKDKDAGDDTRNLQSQILSNIDKLLERLKNPPPQSNESQPMGGASPMNQPSQSQPQSQPSAGSQQQKSQSMTRRERREARRRQEQQARRGQQPMGRSEQKAATSANSPTREGNSVPTSRMPARTGPPETLADVVKDIWGHLPDTMRQEVDQYYREQFMPRYRDLLQQYYLRLAETERRPRDRKP